MKPRRARSALGFDVLESRALLSGPAVSLTALPFTAGTLPQVVVTASDAKPMTEVAIDVAFDGSKSFSGPHDLNQTVEYIALVSGKATTITLNAFPTPDLSSYYVRARVIDSAGNQGVSKVVTMNGPVADAVTLSVPAELTPTNDTATVHITTGARDKLPSTVTLDVEDPGSTTFQPLATATVSASGSASFSLGDLGTGTFKIRAVITDPAGNTDVSSTVSVQPPQPDSISLTAPATITAANYVANVQVNAGKGNGFSRTVYFDLSQNNGPFTQFSSTTINSNGVGVLALFGLPVGTYQIRARATDLGGAAVISAVQTITVEPPMVSISAAPFGVGGHPAVTLTASDANAMTQVAIDVSLDGSPTFAGPNDTNFLVETVSLSNNKPVTIPLNLPTPYLASYLVRAHVIDALGDEGTSNVITLQGPQPDAVTLSVPNTVTAAADTGTIQVSAGQGNGIAGSTANVFLSDAGGPFQPYEAVHLSASGAGTFTFANLASGLYQIKAQVLDSNGMIDSSGISSLEVSPPVVSITPLPLSIGGTPQIVLTASDINPMTQVAVNVGLQGNANFQGPGDYNQTTETINLVNNQPVTISLNAFPTPLLPDYTVQASVTDSVGNVGTSAVATLQGPASDTVALTVPATVTAAANTGTIQVTAGARNGFGSTAYIDTSLNGAPFTQYAAVPLSSSGAGSFTFANLAAGQYQVKAEVVDTAGDIDSSAASSVTISPPKVSITALPLAAGGTPQIVVTASDINAMTQVAVNVSLDGNAKFGSTEDQNQTVQTIDLVNNQPTTISLNAFPEPLLASYSIAASVTDAVGNVGTSSTVTMQGPTPDTVSVSVPTTLSSGNDTAVVSITANERNGYPTTATIGVDPNNDGVFQQYVSGPVNSAGVANIPITGLPAGTYQIEALAVDPAGNPLASAPQTVTVAANSSTPAISTAASANASSATSSTSTSSSTPSNTPLSIVPNVGQVTIAPTVTQAPNIQFVVPIEQSTVYLSPNELDVQVPDGTNAAGEPLESTQSMVLVGADANALGIGQDVQSSYSNFFIGNLAKTNVPNFGQASFNNVYPGISLTYQGGTGTLEYSFTVSPGANPSAIALSFPGDTVSLDSSGDLVLTLPDGSTLTESAPVAYQVNADGTQQAVTCGFAINNNGQVTFSLGSYNSALPLVIDPYIYGNFFNGNASPVNTGNAMATDSCGDIYLLANTHQNDFAGSGVTLTLRDFVVTKLNSSGLPVFTTYVQLAGGDINSNAIAIDGQGDIYVAGNVGAASAATALPASYANSANPVFGAFPTSVALSAFAGDTAFVTSLNPEGLGTAFTLFGGTGSDGTAIAVDGFGNVWVAGNTSATTASGNFAGAFDVGTGVGNGNSSMFLTKFSQGNVSAGGYEYTDLYGVNPGASNVATSIAIDSDNVIYVAGETTSPHNMPWSGADTHNIAAAFQRSAPYTKANPTTGEAGFVLQFQENAATNAGAVEAYAVITYGTFLAGREPVGNNTTATGVFVKNQDAVAGEPNSGYVADVYVTGNTNGGDFFAQSSPGAVQLFPGAFGGNAVDFALELQIGLTSLGMPNTVQEAATFIGTVAVGGSMAGGSIYVDVNGNIYVDGTLPAGEASSAFFDTNAAQPYFGTNENEFLTVLDPTATDVLLGTALGGEAAGETEQVLTQTFPIFAGTSLSVDSSGNIYVGGTANMDAFAANGFQSVIQANGGSSVQIIANASSNGVYVAKLSPAASLSFPNDQFEPNDTSDIPINLDNFQTTNIFGQIEYGPFPNLNTYMHVGGPVGDGLNYNGLYDYDWYQLIPNQTGSLTVTISNIDVASAGPTGAMCMNGDLDLYVYQVVNGFLYLAGSSTLINSPDQSVTVTVGPQFTQGNDYLIDVNPYNYTQASYTMNITMT